MKFKKLLSAVAATAIAASAFAGMAVTASAANGEVTRTISADGLEYTWTFNASDTKNDSFSTDNYAGIHIEDNDGTALGVNGSKSYSYSIGDSANVSSWGIKTGGSSGVSNGIPTRRYISLVPEKDKGNYKISVAFVSGSSDKTRSCYIYQKGATIASASTASAVAFATTSTAQTNVNDTIYIAASENIQLYGIRVVYEGNSQGGETTQPFSVSPASANIFVGETANFTVSNGTIASVSSNTTAATVSFENDTVTVTGVSAGEATITITDTENNTCTCEVSVSNITPSVAITTNTAALTVGGSGKRFGATTVPSGLPVTWSSSNPDVAEVDETTGDVSPIAAGETNIIASISVAGTPYTDSFKVTVIGTGNTGDLVAISSDTTLISSEWAPAGVNLTDKGLYASKRILALGTNGYKTDKKSSTFNEKTYLNCVQVDNSKDKNLALKVSAPCTITLYHSYNSSRAITAGSALNGTTYTVAQEKKSGDYAVSTFTVDAASTIYLGASGGELSIAVIDIAIATVPSEKSYDLTVASLGENGVFTGDDNTSATVYVSEDINPAGYSSVYATAVYTDDNGAHNGQSAEKSIGNIDGPAVFYVVINKGSGLSDVKIVLK